MILCDWAEVVNHKLYIMGAGWDRAVATHAPMAIALALIIHVPWTDTNKKHTAKVDLLTPDGSPALPALPPGAPEDIRSQLKPVQIQAKFEVGRPPGLEEGTSIVVPFAFRIPMIFLEANRYVFQLSIDDAPVENVTFQVVGGP